MTSTTIHPPTTEPAPLTRADLRRSALRDVLRVAPGIVAFGVTLGVTALSTKTGGFAAATGALLVFGGSAQLTTITLLHLGAGLLAAVLSGAVVNARLLLYSAALEPHFSGQPRWFRLLGPAFIQDQTYLSASGRSGYNHAEFRCYWGWLGSILLAVWTGSVVLGVLVGPLLPQMPHLGLVGTALFIAMLMPRLVSRQTLLAASASAFVALTVAHAVPAAGILAGAAAGVATAFWADRGTAA